MFKDSLTVMSERVELVRAEGGEAMAREWQDNKWQWSQAPEPSSSAALLCSSEEQLPAGLG